jgi:hypothetical protein
MAMPEFHVLVNEAKKEIRGSTRSDLKRLQQSGKDDFALIDAGEV